MFEENPDTYKPVCSRCGEELEHWSDRFAYGTMDLHMPSQGNKYLAGGRFSGDEARVEEAYRYGPSLDHPVLSDKGHAQHPILKYGHGTSYQICRICANELANVLGRFFGIDEAYKKEAAAFIKKRRKEQQEARERWKDFDKWARLKERDTEDLQNLWRLHLQVKIKGVRSTGVDLLAREFHEAHIKNLQREFEEVEKELGRRGVLLTDEERNEYLRGWIQKEAEESAAKTNVAKHRLKERAKSPFPDLYPDD